ncbi:Nitroreductase [Paucidesulfovibrio gracilis DSM 16080]|uniref:Nitroreductase n=1 Tax=Paucidesulfovibrio gracilis DSM 16080 TaxID=1121449 RepID=A0A1T4XST1_9BACT|nr:nitroreductase family protein [Paucidesulfovibrio gracilis]SKA92198.1 Nitroreductase [Paucidesulfovibrio gracilis DSM 16080]
MDVFEAMHTRRSIRKYTDEPVSDETVRELLGAAMMAPSAGNAQAWQFVVIRDRALLERVKEFSPYAGMAAGAPLGILVCGDTSLEKYPGYWVQDCSAAMQNLLLAVHAKGLGAVWTGVHPIADREAGFRAMCGLPDNVKPLGFAVIGHPAQERRSEDRFNPERVHWDGYGKVRG